MNMLSLDEITNRISDAILEERFINKSTIAPLIRSILKIWVEQKSALNCENKKDSKIALHLLMSEVEKDFWKQKIKNLVSDSELQLMYDELDVVRESLIPNKKRAKN